MHRGKIFLKPKIAYDHFADLKELVTSGGISIESKDTEGEIYALTLVQPDGDIVSRVRRGSNPSLYEQHYLEVGDHLTAVGKLLGNIQLILTFLGAFLALLCQISLVFGKLYQRAGTDLALVLWQSCRSLLIQLALISISAYLLRVFVLPWLIRRFTRNLASD